MEFIAEDELVELSAQSRVELDSILVRAKNKMMEDLLCSIPDMLLHIAAKQEAMKKLYEKLLLECPEAKEDKQTLATVIQKLELENPGMPPDKLFALAPAEYRALKALEKTVGVVDMNKLNESINGIL